MTLTKQLYFLLALLLCLSCLHAQSVAPLWCHQIGTKEGLSSQTFNYYTFLDQTGFIWFSSTRGLNRFDGRRVVNYRSDPGNPHALTGENIQSRMLEDQQRNLWFCTYQAIHCYRRETDDFLHFTVLKSDGTPLQEDYLVFALERDSFLWFRGGHHIYRVNIHAGNDAFSAAQPLVQLRRFHGSVVTNPQGQAQYLLGYDDTKSAGFDAFEINADGLVRPLPTAAPLNTWLQQHRKGVFQIEKERADLFWLATANELIAWNPLDGTFQAKTTFPAGTAYVSMCQASPDEMLISCYPKHLYRFQKTTLQLSPLTLRSARDPREKNMEGIRNLYLDRNRTLWMCRPLEGIVYANLDKNKFRILPALSAADRPVAFEFSAMLQDRSSRIWCAEFHRINILNPQGQLIRVLDTLHYPALKYNINHLALDNRGNVWVATANGILLIDPATFTCSNLGIPGDFHFLRLLRLHDGRMLASSLAGGVYLLSEKKYTRLQGSPDLPCTSLYQDRNGLLYVCVNEAELQVFGIDGESLQRRHSLGLQGEINAFFESPFPDSSLWIGTASGLAKINQFRPELPPKWYNSLANLPDIAINALAPGGGDTLWIGTENGLSRYGFNTGNHRVFSLADGIQSRKFSGNAALRLTDGRLWLAGQSGITEIPTGPAPDAPVQARILLSGIKINDEVPDSLICARTGIRDMQRIEHVSLEPEQNTLSFLFSANDYADPEGIQVRYTLAGYDKDWIWMQPGQEGFIRYANLPYRDFDLYIQASNSDGLWNSAPKIIHITIRPPFTQTPLFYGILAFTLLALTSGALWWYTRAQRQKSERQVREAENRMSLLIAQMNPHFIFNSLQSINSYILDNHRQQASEYLGRFSKLMRQILNNSRKGIKNHLLQDEINFISDYMDIEAKRFKDPFEYTIQVADDIDPFAMDIPSMLLQPFVENAVWHGLHHKESKGHLELGFRLDQGRLCISVQDDGVGREKAAEIARQSGKKHQSKALEIIRERLTLLFGPEHKNWFIRFTDLFHPDQTPAGTRVEIIFPAIF